MLAAEDCEFLTRVPIFAALPPAALARVAALARRVDHGGGTVVCAEGDPAREMFVVLRGELEVRKRGRSGADTRIALLAPGDVVGEMALIDIQPRSAEVRTLGAASLAVLTHADLAVVHREDAASYLLLVLNIAREISRRLRRLDALLADIVTDVHETWAGAMAEGTGRVGGARR